MARAARRGPFLGTKKSRAPQKVKILFILQAQSIHIVRFEKRNEFTLRFLKGTM
jgi:hypothetical protein